VDRFSSLGQDLRWLQATDQADRRQEGTTRSGMTDGKDEKYDVFIDARGLACPMPLIKARQAIMVVEPGATICVLATDPTSMRDFEMFVEATGHRLLRQEQQDDIFLYVLEKVEAIALD
jgi:tRNA 2-thiouridine synthesizing protein A